MANEDDQTKGQVGEDVSFLTGETMLYSYGSMGSDQGDKEEDDDLFEVEAQKIRRADSGSSFHLGTSKVATANVWASKRITQSFIDYGGKYEEVPTLLKENFALLLDPNLDPRDKGHLYLSQDAFYNVSEEVHYALTVNSDIYRRILNEIHDSKNVPCGLYFCCHGGDGAHTGVSHNDYVDITLAWVLLGIFMLAIIASSIVEGTT